MVCICPPDSNNNFANEIISSTFSECVYNWHQMVSFILGWISIFCWAFALYPSIRLSFLLRTTEAISPYFIITLFCGDVLNLVSVILLRALFTQIVLCSSWVAIDIVILLQIAIYSSIRKKNKKRNITVPILNRKTKVSGCETIIYIFVGLFIIANLVWAGIHYVYVVETKLKLNETVESCIKEPLDKKSSQWITGTVFGYLTIPLYIVSRPGQLVTLCKRKTGYALEPTTFALTIAGNILNIGSIYFFDQSQSYLIERTPFVLSAIIPAIIDMVIIGLWCRYRKKDKKREKELSIQENPLFIKEVKTIPQNQTTNKDLDNHKIIPATIFPSTMI